MWIKSTYLLAKLRCETEGPTNAIPVLQTILPALQEKYSAQPYDSDNRRLLIDVLIYEGICRNLLRQYDQTNAIWNEVEGMLKNHHEPDDQLLHSRLCINRGKTASDQRNTLIAVNYAKQAQEISKKLTKSNPEILEGRYCLATSTGNLAQGLASLGKSVDAEKTFHQAIDLWQGIVADRPKDLLPQLELLRSQISLAEMLLFTRRFDEANKELAKGMSMVERLMRTFPQSNALRTFHGQFRLYSGLCDHMTNKPTGAEKHYQKAVDSLISYHEDAPVDLRIEYDLIRARLLQAFLWQDMRRLPEALKSYEQLLEMLDHYAQEAPEAGAEMKGRIHTLHFLRYLALAEVGKSLEARAELEKINNSDPYFPWCCTMVLLLYT